MRFLNKKNPNGISVFETLILGVSLSLNAMAGGFGVSLSGHNTIVTSCAVGGFSYLTIFTGQNLAGNYASKWLGSFSQRLAGILLMAIGIYELLF